MFKKKKKVAVTARLNWKCEDAVGWKPLKNSEFLFTACSAGEVAYWLLVTTVTISSALTAF